MNLRELFEGVVPTFAKSGNKTTRKYRCTSGSRKGRIVAKASTCSAPKNVKASVTLKRTKRRKSPTMSVKSTRSKTANPGSVRAAKSNKSSRRRSRRRSRI